MRGRNPHRMRKTSYWNRARVIAGLRRFYERFAVAPTAHHLYHAIVKGDGRTWQREFPAAYAVALFFPTMRQAWTAAGIFLDRSHEPYTVEEDWYLHEAVGILSRAQIAEDLRRTEGSVKRRMYDLGIDARTRWGWALHRVAEHTQVPGHLFDGYFYRGELPYFRGNRFIYIDPADLLDIDLIDWRRCTQALKDAVRKSLMDRAAKIIAGVDWRAARPHRAQPLKKTDRVYNWQKRHVERSPMPYALKRGDIVEVRAVYERRKVQPGRRGIVHLVMWSRATRATSASESEWVARVEFKKEKRHGKEATRVWYTLPLASLKKVRRRKGDPELPEAGLKHSETREWYKVSAGQRRKGARLKRQDTMRKERIKAEAERMQRRDNRRARTEALDGPFRGRSATRGRRAA